MPSVQAQVGGGGVDRQMELTLWQSIDGEKDPALYEAYLAQFPNGMFANVARLKIAKLRGAVQSNGAPAQQPYAAPQAYPSQPAYPAQQPYAAPQPYGAPQAYPAPQPVPAYTQPSPVAPVPQGQPQLQPQEQAVPTQQAVPVPVPQQPSTAPATPSAAPDSGTATPQAGAGGDQLQELNRTLQAMVNSQVSTPVATPSADTPAPVPAVQQPVPAPAPVSVPVPVAAPAPVAPQVINGVSIPPPPVLEPVAAVQLPARFCTDVERNTFHRQVYSPAIAAAKRNNEAAVAYMARLNATYEQYHLSDNTIAQNAIVTASRAYEPQAQAAFVEHDALVRLYAGIMAVPIIACPPAQ